MHGMHWGGNQKFRYNESREGGRYEPQKGSNTWWSDRDEEIKVPEKVSTKGSTRRAVA